MVGLTGVGRIGEVTDSQSLLVFRNFTPVESLRKYENKSASEGLDPPEAGTGSAHIYYEAQAMSTFSRIVVFLIVLVQVALMSDPAFAGRDGFPGRRVGGGSRYTNPHPLALLVPMQRLLNQQPIVVDKRDRQPADLRFQE